MVTYYKAHAVADALEVLGRQDIEAKALLGGTDLLVGLGDRLDSAPGVVVDLKGLADGEPLAVTDSGVRIGLTVTMADLVANPTVAAWYPALVQAAAEVGSVAIRNRATLVGNICNASPASDTAPALLVHGARVRIASADGERVVPISEFFVAPRVTTCGRGELVTAVELSRPVPGTGSAFQRLTRRWGVDLATVSVAAAVHGDGRVQLGLGAVAPTPLLVDLPAATDLSDRAALDPLLDEVLTVATPISDIRAGADYRTAMVRELAARTLRAALDSTRRTQA